MSDATMRVLERIGKPEYWDHIDVGVPFFTEHEEEVEDKNGKKVKLKIDEARLHKILDKILMLERTTGTLPIITEGHRVPIKHFPESKQPDVLGIMGNPRIGRFGPEKKLAIVGDPHYIKGKFEKAKELPFRSAEVYLAELDPNTPYPDELTAVALLKKDPRQNLGVMVYGRGEFSRESQAYHFSIGDYDEEGHHIPAEEIDPDFEDHYMRCTRKTFPHLEKYHTEHMAKHYMAAATPTNVAVPEPVTKKLEPHAMERDEIVAQFQREMKETVENLEKKHQEELSKVTARVVQLEAERAALQRDNQYASFERDLTALRDVEGFDIDPTQEVADAKEEGLAPERFAKRIEWIKKNARKVPITPFGRNGAPTAFSGASDPKLMNGHKSKPVTPKMVNDAVIAAKPGEDSAQAFQRIFGFEMPPQ